MDDSSNGGETRHRRRKDARPGEIIEAGLLEFAEHGFAAAKLDSVAQRAGIVKGTIYRYFESKEALFEAALQSGVAPVFDDIEQLADAYTGPAAEGLRIIITNMYQQLFTNNVQILLRIIIAEGSRFPAIAELYHRQIVSKGKAVLGKIVERGVVSGEFRSGAAASLPMVVAAPAIMAVVWKMTFEPFEPIPIERFLPAHIDLVLNGLKAPDKA